MENLLKIEILPADYFNDSNNASPLIRVDWADEDRVQTVEEFRELCELDSIDHPLGAIADIVPSQYHDAVMEAVKRECEKEGVWK
jgi:hypothetical protein